MLVDLFLVYNLIKRLATPFSEWDAFKLGIIDDNGDILRKRRDLKTIEERKAWGKFDVMISKLKKIIEKAPGGKTRIATYAAALYLIKESEHINTINQRLIVEEDIQSTFNEYFVYVENNFQLLEEVPVNSAGGGNIAGIGVGPKDKAEPGFNSRQMRRHKKKNKILKRLKEK